MKIIKKNYLTIIVLIILLIGIILNVYIINNNKIKFSKARENGMGIIEEAQIIPKEEKETIVFEIENQEEVNEEIEEKDKTANKDNIENSDAYEDDLVIGTLRIPKIRIKY